MSLFEAAEFDGHEEVVFFTDQPTRLRAILAVHDTTLGRRWAAAGSCRTPPRPRRSRRPCACHER